MAPYMVEWISVLKNLQLTLTVSHLWGPMTLGVIHKFVNQNCIQTLHKSVKSLPSLDGANKQSFFKLKMNEFFFANLCQKTSPIIFFGNPPLKQQIMTIFLHKVDMMKFEDV